ncbi:LCR [Medicago truncatula]|uniref:LCR n=1 Tax=Medicago truncatula TaxID=3880 RepID=G7ZWY2_MEDTR|nr:LCR [Medicago truncatula]
MVSHAYQSRLCWILCFVMVFLSGFATSFGGDPPGLRCRGQCKDPQQCNQFCLNNGFKKGGVCLASGANPNFKICCCHS